MMRFEGEGSNTNGASKPFPSDPAAILAKGAMSKSINGSHRAISALNGSPATNRLSETVKRPSSTYFGHDREEVSRLLIQALLDLGYDSTAANLIQESGFELEDPTVAAFRNAVLQGEWAEAEALRVAAEAQIAAVRLVADREWQATRRRLIFDLEMPDGPRALRAVLPAARFLRWLASLGRGGTAGEAPSSVPPKEGDAGFEETMAELKAIFERHASGGILDFGYTTILRYGEMAE